MGVQLLLNRRIPWLTKKRWRSWSRNRRVLSRNQLDRSHCLHNISMVPGYSPRLPCNQQSESLQRSWIWENPIWMNLGILQVIAGALLCLDSRVRVIATKAFWFPFLHDGRTLEAWCGPGHCERSCWDCQSQSHYSWIWAVPMSCDCQCNPDHPWQVCTDCEKCHAGGCRDSQINQTSVAGVSTLIGEQDLTGLLSRWIEQHSPSVLILIAARLTAGFQADEIPNDLVDPTKNRTER